MHRAGIIKQNVKQRYNKMVGVLKCETCFSGTETETERTVKQAKG